MKSKILGQLRISEGNPATKWISLALLIAFLALFLQIPLFDLDEALYLRMAQEMKSLGQYAVPHWDGAPVHDKPPLFLWLILASDELFRFLLPTSAAPQIREWVARVPGLFFSLLTAGLVYWSAGPLQKIAGDVFQKSRSPQNPFVYGLFLFPLAAAAVCLIDPILSFFLFLTFLGIQRSADSISRMVAPFLMITLGVAASVMLKGLIGFIVPALGVALFLFLALVIRSTESRRLKTNPSHWRVLESFLKEHSRLFGLLSSSYLAAFIISGFYYYWIGLQPGGLDFLKDFFWEHHFGRGTQAMEGHSGPFFYHLLVVYLGGGIGFAFWCDSLARRLRSADESLEDFWRRSGLAISWIFAIVGFFSLMATKLPNYTWPVWPLMAWSLCQLRSPFGPPLATQSRTPIESHPKTSPKVQGDTENDMGKLRWLWGLTAGPTLLIGIAFIVLSAFGLLFSEQKTSFLELLGNSHMGLDSRIPLVAQRISLPNEMEWLALGTSGVLFIFVFKMTHKSLSRRSLDQALTNLFLLQTTALTLLLASMLTPLRRNLREPLEALEGLLSRDLSQTPSNTPIELASVGMRSPTLSLMLPKHSIQRFHKSSKEPFVDLHYSQVVLPVWLEKKCTEFGYEVSWTSGVWTLCQKDRNP